MCAMLAYSSDLMLRWGRPAGAWLVGLGMLLAVLPAPLAAASLPGEAVIEVAAFGVTPMTQAVRIDSDSRDIPGQATARVARGDSWSILLGRLLGDQADSSVWRDALRGADLPELLPGRFLRVLRAETSGSWLVEYLRDARSAFSLRLDGRVLRVTERLPGDDLLRAAHQDELKTSLFAATDAVGLPEDIALQLVDIFAEEVDFLRDLGKGYRCAIVYEMNYVEGMPRPGRVLAAEFSGAEGRIAAYLHRFGNGESGYFNAAGMDVNRVLRPDTGNLKRSHSGSKAHSIDAAASFRRSPLEFSRITSAPARLRFHPILKQWRAHRGTDYAAPIGTKVKATAAGEVFFVGTRGSYGNLVILRHYGRFSTFYGHLNGFASGLAFGDQVRKGEVIGYVGMTGLATGPHLHYELRDDLAPGSYDTPLVVRSISDAETPAFQARMQGLRQQLDYAYRANLVMLE
jgi:murein DD-endopeptidase MepM/ murein hydrolase activator NlpD